MSVSPLRTERLILRQWRDADLEPLAAMSADPEVMALLPGPIDRARAEAAVARWSEHIAEHGFGFWALEAPGLADFIGIAGLAPIRYQAHFTPAVEIGWRLARPHWGRGYATEAARAALEFGFGRLDLAEITANTTPMNHRSRAVMARLGMRRNVRDDFDHPLVPEGNRLRRHVLYRLSREAWAVHR
jgi:RimJ/RimL family protein N-acetyltransferase